MSIYIKRVFRYDSRQRKLRLVRFLWRQDSRALSVGLIPVLFRWENEYGEWRLNLLGLELHSLTAGGRFTR